MNITMDQLARPGGRIDAIAQRRSAEFNRSFFGHLYDRANNSNLSYDLYGNVDYTGSSSFPTLEESWNVYRTEAQKRMVKADYVTFKQQYDQINEVRNQKSVKDMFTATSAGVSSKSMRNLASKNPEFHKHILNISATNPELAMQLSEFLPQKKFSQQFDENPMAFLGAGGAALGGGIAAYNFLNTGVDPAGAAKSAIGGYKNQLSRASTELKKARAYLNKVEAKGGQGTAYHKTAKKELADAQKKFKNLKADRRLSFKEKNVSRMDKFNKSTWGKGYKGALVRGGAMVIGPELLGTAAEGITGSEKVGDLASSGSRAAMGAKFSVDAFRTAVGKHGMSAILREIGRVMGFKGVAKLGLKGLVGAGGSVASGGLIGAAMAAWTLNDLKQVMQIISEME